MLFFGVGGAGGLSMQARRAASTLAHPAVLKPADAQHARTWFMTRWHGFGSILLGFLTRSTSRGGSRMAFLDDMVTFGSLGGACYCPNRIAGASP
jgi:hypothetical protein